MEANNSVRLSPTVKFIEDDKSSSSSNSSKEHLKGLKVGLTKVRFNKLKSIRKIKTSRLSTYPKRT